MYRAFLLILSMVLGSNHSMGNVEALESILVGFSDASGLSGEPCLRVSFQQSWLEQAEDRFEPGFVWVYSGADELVVVAVLADVDICNTAQGFNTKTWQTGDVFECFLLIHHNLYYELHVTPENENLFLRWSPASFRAVRADQAPFDDALIEDTSFASSQTIVDKEHGYWLVSLRVPYASLEVGDIDKPRNSAISRIAFGRYDANRGDSEPILSATPHLTEVNFHLSEAWHPLFDSKQ